MINDLCQFDLLQLCIIITMDNENKPNLSQYFANDPPSFFDELYDKSNGKLEYDFFRR